jgi:putative SOS response-associated peptidase YedK
MCGRFALIGSPEEARALFGYIDEDWFPPRYNIAPTQPIAVVTEERGRRRLKLMRWGLVPSWVKEPKSFSVLFNARREGIAERPAFKAAIRYRRCLVPASGFYEWQRVDGRKKQPYWVPPAKGGLIAFAGVFETWLGADGSEIDSASIITAPAGPDTASIHDRVPVVIEPEDFERWLGRLPPDAVEDLMATPPQGTLRPMPVGEGVNAARNDGPELIEPVAAARPIEDPQRRFAGF